MSSELKENKMGTMPMKRLLASISLPLVISMLMQAMYNVVDSLFVSRVSENALTAVSLAFPVQNFMIAVGVGTGVGMNAYLSRSLGEKNKHDVDLAANNGIFLAIMNYIVMLILGLLLTKVYYKAQTDIAEIIEGGEAYLQICIVGSFGLFLQLSMERLLQSTGKAFFSMITQLVGAILNIIFDPIFIFGYFGIPAMGVTGAALSTILGQIIAMFIGLILNIKINKEITISPKGFRPNLGAIKRIYSVGIPSIVMQSVSSVMTFGMNNILMVFSSTATAVFGVYFKLQSFVIMPVLGLNNGMVPVISYNYGARNRQRIIQAIKLSMIAAFCIMLIGLILFQTVPVQILALFDASPQMLEIGVPALKIISIHFILAGFDIIMNAVFQAFGKGFYSLLTSLTRQLIVLLPVAYILSKTKVLANVWWCFPIAEIVCVTVSICFMTVIYKKIIKNI